MTLAHEDLRDLLDDVLDALDARGKARQLFEDAVEGARRTRSARARAVQAAHAANDDMIAANRRLQHVETVADKALAAYGQALQHKLDATAAPAATHDAA